MSMIRVELYEDKAGEHRWRNLAANGEIVSDSAEGYSRRGDAREAAQREHPGVPIVEVAPADDRSGWPEDQVG